MTTTDEPTEQELRTLALAAVKQAQTEDAPNVRLRATKLVHDQVKARLARPVLGPSLAAVDWALSHPDASSLDLGSAVATKSAAYFKDGEDRDQPWLTTTGHIYINRADDEEVTELIQSGEATVLRVGSGA